MQLPGDGVGPERLSRPVTLAWAGSEPPLPLKGVQLPAWVPARHRPPSLRPPGQGKAGRGVHTKGGAAGERTQEAAAPAPRGLASLPQGAGRRPPL
jgi:hypothetical protein